MTLKLCLSVFLCLLGIFLSSDASVGREPAKHICVIGAGYSGLAAARYLNQHGVNYTILEATKYVGGTWRFDPRVGTDEDGLPMFTSMYKHLRTNTPRETMEYPDFKFPEGTPSYPTATCFYKYLKSFAKKFGLYDRIQFKSYVTSVRWAKDHWDVTYLRTDTRVNETMQCDFLIVANGKYNKPVLPKFEGLETFRGKVIHSHDYKDPEDYKGRRVLIVGAGPSGLDLALHLQNHTSKLVHSHHLAYNQPNFPESYVKKPDIKYFTQDGVMFKDDTFEQVDDVILCTGYNFGHPFFDESVGLIESGKFVLPLYQQMVNIKHPSMVVIGVIRKIIIRVLDVQVEYAAALAAGKFQLPPQEEMLRSFLENAYGLKAKGKNITDINLLGSRLDNYFASLTEEAGVKRAPPVLSSILTFNEKTRLRDLQFYREYNYKILDDQHYDWYYHPGHGEDCPIDI